MEKGHNFERSDSMKRTFRAFVTISLKPNTLQCKNVHKYFGLIINASFKKP